MLAVLLQELSPDAPAVFTVNETVVSLVMGTLLPVVVGVLLRDGTPNWVKVVVGGAVAVLATLIKEAIQADGSATFSQDFVIQFFMVWIPQVAAYYGIWRPLSINTVTGPGVIGPAAPEAPNRTDRTLHTP
jgi:hypothetical protein